MTIDPRTVAADIMTMNARDITPSEVWAHIGQMYDTTDTDASVADEIADLIAKTGIDLIWPDGSTNTELDAARVEIERLRADIDDRDSEISTLKQDLDLQTKAAWDNNAQVADLADKLHKAQQENASHTKAGTAWANEMTAKDKVIDAAKAWAKSSVAGIESRPHEEALYAAVQSLPKAQAGEAVYLIWSNHHHYWFAPNGCGYRSNPADAGRYTLADAQKWLGRGCDCCRVPEVLVRADVVSGAGERTIRGAIAEATRAAIESGDVNRCYEPVAEVAQ